MDASIVLAMVLLSAALNFFQTYRSHLAVESLREQVAPPATALRDGEWVEIPRRDLVPGDVIRLRAGSQIPADGILLEAQHLHLEQAALTGESLPVEKDASSEDDATLGPNAANLIFRGTSVVSGTATARITATGPRTLFGDLAARLATRRPQTEFERGLQQFSLLITRTVFFVVLFVFSVTALAGRPVLESLLFAIALEFSRWRERPTRPRCAWRESTAGSSRASTRRWMRPSWEQTRQGPCRRSWARFRSTSSGGGSRSWWRRTAAAF